MDFLVTLPDGKIRSVFSDRVRELRNPAGQPRTVRFQLHGSYCGGSGNASCFKEHRITDKRSQAVRSRSRRSDDETCRSACAVLLALTAGVADAKGKQRPFKVTDYPLEVRKTLSLGPVTCRDVEGGGKVEFAPDTVRKVDFNGDGRVDYIVSFENAKCGESKARFCGTGGCMVDFLVTLPNGRLRSVFAGQIHGYEILRGASTQGPLRHIHAIARTAIRLLQGPADRVQLFTRCIEAR